MLTLEKNTLTMNCDYSDKKAVMARLRRSFSEGVGSIVSLKGGYIRMPLGSARTDAIKLKGDWETVYRELRLAYESLSENTYSSNHGKTSQQTNG